MKFSGTGICFVVESCLKVSNTCHPVHVRLKFFLKVRKRA